MSVSRLVAVRARRLRLIVALGVNGGLTFYDSQLTLVENQVAILPPADDVIHTDDVLLISIFSATHDGCASLDPRVTAVLVHHAVVMC